MLTRKLEAVLALRLEDGTQERSHGNEEEEEEETEADNHSLALAPSSLHTGVVVLDADERLDRALQFARFTRRGRLGSWEAPIWASEGLRDLVASLD